MVVNYGVRLCTACQRPACTRVPPPTNSLERTNTCM